MKYRLKLEKQFLIGLKHMTETIYFDARYIRVGHHDGISRFSAGLCAALATKADVTAIISDERQLEKLPNGIKHVKLNDPTKAFAELFIALKLNRLGAKKVFSPMQTMGSWFRKYKLVLTLHDLIYYAHPTPPPSFSWPIRLGWRLFHLTYIPQRFMLNGADSVVTVSETTKKLMLENRLTKRAIDVVYNAGSGDTSTEHAQANRNLIYMGSFMDYKNVECLIAGMENLPDFQLHLLSRITEERRTELENLSGASSKRVIFHNGVSDEEYHQLLSGAFALVSASKDEGFGIPVIEAMDLGTPAVISDIEIFREVGGSAARYFDPTDPTSFAAKVRLLEADWSDASSASRLQAKKFNWKASADALLKVLQKV
jgi:glycosyltransferase involved in cell wall biosynthesis